MILDLLMMLLLKIENMFKVIDKKLQKEISSPLQKTQSKYVNRKIGYLKF